MAKEWPTDQIRDNIKHSDTVRKKQSPNRRGGKDMMIRVMVIEGNSHQGRNRYSNMEEAKVKKPPACIGGKGR